jgi:hypothetical protein
MGGMLAALKEFPILLGSALVKAQALWQGCQFATAAVRSPDYAAISEKTHDGSAGRPAQGFYPIARLEGSGFTEAVDNLNHRLTVKHTSDVVGDCRHHLAPSPSRQLSEKSERRFTSDGRKCVSVEEEEGRTAMK